MLASSILEHLTKRYYTRQNDSPNVMVNSVTYHEHYHERVPNQKRVIRIHISPDTTIHTPNRLSMSLEYDPNTK